MDAPGYQQGRPCVRRQTHVGVTSLWNIPWVQAMKAFVRIPLFFLSLSLIFFLALSIFNLTASGKHVYNKNCLKQIKKYINDTTV